MTRVLLVRHGQSTWNASGRWQGRADPGLSELGRRQAADAAVRLQRSDSVPTGVHSSSLRRALQTATILATELGLPAPMTHDDLRERDVGEWTGLTAAQIDRRWPGALGPPRLDPPPGGETRADVQVRVERGLTTLRDGDDRVSVAVVHGGVIRTIERLVGVEPGPIPNLVGWWLHWDGRAWRSGDRSPLCDDVTTPLSP